MAAPYTMQMPLNPMFVSCGEQRFMRKSLRINRRMRKYRADKVEAESSFNKKDGKYQVKHFHLTYSMVVIYSYSASTILLKEKDLVERCGRRYCFRGHWHIETRIQPGRHYLKSARSFQGAQVCREFWSPSKAQCWPDIRWLEHPWHLRASGRYWQGSQDLRVRRRWIAWLMHGRRSRLYRQRIDPKRYRRRQHPIW